MERLALRLKVNSLSQCGLVAPILLHEFFTLKNKKVELVQGHCIINGKANWHVWVTDGTTIFDISAHMLNQTDLEYHTDKNCTCDKSILQKMSGSLDILSEWETFKSDPGKFWKQVPVKTQNVRREILKKIKNNTL